MERDCINNFLDLISAFFHLRIISRIWNQYANNPRKILIPKFSNNSKRTNKFPQPRFSFLPSPESFPMQMRILPNRPFLDSKRWRFRNLKLIREYIKKVKEGGKIDWKERSEKISSLDTAGYGNKRNRWTGVRLSAPIEYTTRLYRNRETNGADGTQKRIEARVDQTIRYRPLVVVVVVVSRSAGGLGGGRARMPRGGGGKLKSSFTWKRFDWRRSANDFRSATARRLSTPPIPPADHFFESGGGPSAVGRDPNSAADRDVMIAIFR